jgi:hypothetical protein
MTWRGVDFLEGSWAVGLAESRFGWSGMLGYPSLRLLLAETLANKNSPRQKLLVGLKPPKYQYQYQY